MTINEELRSRLETADREGIDSVFVQRDELRAVLDESDNLRTQLASLVEAFELALTFIPEPSPDFGPVIAEAKAALGDV